MGKPNWSMAIPQSDVFRWRAEATKRGIALSALIREAVERMLRAPAASK